MYQCILTHGGFEPILILSWYWYITTFKVILIKVPHSSELNWKEMHIGVMELSISQGKYSN